MPSPAPTSVTTAAGHLLLAVQVGDAVACAIPLPIIRRELDRLGCPPAVRRALPVVKAASVVGLLAGSARPQVGRITAMALLGYFACAIGAHARTWATAGSSAPSPARG